MHVPEDLRYSSEHEWARRTADDHTVRVGITDFAQDSLGDVVFVELPAVGAAVSSGQSVGELESTKSVSEMYAPVSGTVTAVNSALIEQPQLLNSDPYGDGWLCEIAIPDATEFESLLDAGSYRTLIGG